MSNIEPNIVDPTKGPGPDVVPGIDDPAPDQPLPGTIREPGEDLPPIEPDPEERGPDVPGRIDRA